MVVDTVIIANIILPLIITEFLGGTTTKCMVQGLDFQELLNVTPMKREQGNSVKNGILNFQRR